MDRSGGGCERAAGRRRTDTTDPRRSRARALRILFQADLRDVPPSRILGELVEDGRGMIDGEEDGPEPAAPVDAFTCTLVAGVEQHREALDALIQRFAHHWAIARMPVVDRCVLRLATYELMHEATAPAVVINEAVELVKQLSTEDSGRFVNGVLESIRRHLTDDAAAGATP